MPNAAPSVDPRWDSLSGEWTCSICEERHQGLFDLACFAPVYWNDEEIYAPNSQLNLEEDFLSEDFCVIAGEDFFIRCVLKLPLIGSTQSFGYGVWVSASRSNFEFYIDRFDSGDFSPDDGWFGWFSNDLKGYPECNQLKCDVVPQSGRQRPLIVLHDADHPLVVEQMQGVEFDRLTDIYKLNGHAIALS